jgi:hypothetical protein
VVLLVGFLIGFVFLCPYFSRWLKCGQFIE